MDRIYISATAQHAGKTTTSLGLYRLFEQAGRKVSYIKPVGQRYLEYQGHKVDEDAVLFKQNLKCETPIDAMSAVTIPRGFTEEYIFNRNKAKIYDDIDQAIMKLDESVDMTIIEGTGHAGVGSVFDASNAVVACLLGAKAVIISGGGIGKCLDQIALNQALFEQENVQIMGAIINKVLPDKYDKIKRCVGQGLKNMDINCLGVIPYEPELTFPTVDQLINDCKLDLLYGDEQMQMNHTENYVMAALPAGKLAERIQKETLLVVPSGGVDLLLEQTITNLQAGNLIKNISCLLFTDGYCPKDQELEQLKAFNAPILHTSKDAFNMAAKLGNLIVKISPKDANKVGSACSLMEKHLDMEKITTLLQD